MNESLLKEYIIAEIARYKREGVKLPNVYEQFKEWVGPDSFIHFSNINKLGIKPTYSHHTPAGLYGYPFDEQGYERFVNDRFEYASKYKYVHLMTLNSRDGIYEINQDIPEEEFKEKIEKLREINGQFTLNKFAYYGNYIQSIYEVVQDSDLLPFEKRKAFIYCGINGFIDRGQSFITNDLESQAVFFNPTMIDQKLVAINPNVKKNLDDLIAGKISWISSTSIENLPQNIADKLLFDKHTSSDVKSSALGNASVSALKKFLDIATNKDNKIYALQYLLQKAPNKIPKFLFHPDLNFREQAIKQASPETLSANLDQILKIERDFVNLYWLVNRVSISDLPKFLPYITQLNDGSYGFNAFFRQLKNRMTINKTY